MNKHKTYMQRAIDLSIENVKNGGGPFGAVIVKNGEIIAEGVNRVTANCDLCSLRRGDSCRQAV